MVQQIEEEVRKKKTLLAPGIKKLRNLRQKMADDEEVYVVKKKEYDDAVNKMDGEKMSITNDMGSSFNEYKESESKFHQNNVQSDIFETFQRRIQREAQYVSKPEARLLPEVKTFQEYFNIKRKQQEDVMTVLRQH